MPWFGVIGLVAWATVEATDQTLGVSGSIPNPYANPQVASIANAITLVFFPALIGTIASLFVRYRSAEPVERVQIRWVAFGGLVQILVWFGIWGWAVVFTDTFNSFAVAIAIVALLITPGALVLAIMRYHLYDIDRVISRVASYALLTTLLGATYFGGVLAMQSLLPTSDSLAVAVSILTIAAAFNSLRRRLHVATERRFNRSHMDAQQLLEAFSQRTRSLNDPEALRADIGRVVETSFSPSAISIWVRS